jgi:hypothetical protein
VVATFWPLVTPANTDVNSAAVVIFSLVVEHHRSQMWMAAPAQTIDGLRVKARAACWALLGDLDDGDPSTMDKRIALSIVRDLIRV